METTRPPISDADRRLAAQFGLPDNIWKKVSLELEAQAKTPTPPRPADAEHDADAMRVMRGGL